MNIFDKMAALKNRITEGQKTQVELGSTSDFESTLEGSRLLADYDYFMELFEAMRKRIETILSGPPLSKNSFDELEPKAVGTVESKQGREVSADSFLQIASEGVAKAICKEKTIWIGRIEYFIEDLPGDKRYIFLLLND